MEDAGFLDLLVVCFGNDVWKVDDESRMNGILVRRQAGDCL